MAVKIEYPWGPTVFLSGEIEPPRIISLPWGLYETSKKIHIVEC
jgi:hypothetical protein